MRNGETVGSFRVEADVMVGADIRAVTKEEAVELFKKELMDMDGRVLGGKPHLTIMGDSPANFTVDMEPFKEK